MDEQKVSQEISEVKNAIVLLADRIVESSNKVESAASTLKEVQERLASMRQQPPQSSAPDAEMIASAVEQKMLKLGELTSAIYKLENENRDLLNKMKTAASLSPLIVGERASGAAASPQDEAVMRSLYEVITEMSAGQEKSRELERKQAEVLADSLSMLIDAVSSLQKSSDEMRREIKTMAALVATK